MKKAIFSEARDPENRSNKDCVCGGHNSNNAKKSLPHNATRAKLNRRIEARHKRQVIQTEDDDLFEVECPLCGETESSDKSCDFCQELEEEK